MKAPSNQLLVRVDVGSSGVDVGSNVVLQSGELVGARLDSTHVPFNVLSKHAPKTFFYRVTRVCG